uniref:LIM zinc-binding domain-containing protein n=1 Tax=Macrostomum lignano TaxID=282301 RepID=A0A1I8FAX3_9PLAT
MAGNRHSPPTSAEAGLQQFRVILLQRRMAAFGTAEPDSNEGDCLVQPATVNSLSSPERQLNKHQSSPTISNAPAACSHCGESFDVSDKVLKAGGSEACNEWCLK